MHKMLQRLKEPINKTDKPYFVIMEQTGLPAVRRVPDVDVKKLFFRSEQARYPAPNNCFYPYCDDQQYFLPDTNTEMTDEFVLWWAKRKQEITNRILENTQPEKATPGPKKKTKANESGVLDQTPGTTKEQFDWYQRNLRAPPNEFVDLEKINEQPDSQKCNGPLQSTVKGKCKKKEKRPNWSPRHQPTDPRFGCGINDLEGYETDDDSPDLFAKNPDGTFARNRTCDNCFASKKTCTMADENHVVCVRCKEKGLKRCHFSKSFRSGLSPWKKRHRQGDSEHAQNRTGVT